MAKAQDDKVAGEPTAGLQAESDQDLLTYMSWHKDDPRSATAAAGVFYMRHIRYVFGVCKKCAKEFFLGDDCVEDLAADTFVRAYERAGTFDAAGITDPEKLRLRVRGWLGRIGRNVVMDALRGKRAAPQVNLDPGVWGKKCTNTEEVESADSVLVRRAMQEVLDDREREVIRVTLMSYKPDSGCQRMSNEDTALLAGSLQTTPENLRKIRRNAMLKLRNYLIEASPQTHPEHLLHGLEVSP